MWCLPLGVMVPANHFGVSFNSQEVGDVFHWVLFCLLIILGCHSTLSGYVMPSIGCDAAHWSFWAAILLSVGMWCLPLGVMLPADHVGHHPTLRKYVMSSIRWCCLLIILECLSTFSGYVMSFIVYDTVHWSFWGVIIISAGMWCPPLAVMLPANHFGLPCYFQEVCNVFYWEWCYLLIIFGLSFYSQRVCDVFHWVWYLLPADHFGVSFYSQEVCDVFH